MPVALITGLGLMGGSLAAALTQAGWTVRLHHRRPEVAERAQALGYGTAVLDPVSAMGDVDVAVIGTPAMAVAASARALAAGGGGAVITDVASTKAGLCRELNDLGAAGRFVGSHPMAGSHHQGLEHADATLYRGRLVVLTPVPGTPDDALRRVAELWRAAGCILMTMPPAAHDAAVVAASHLPHVLACAAAAALDDASAPLAASGFRDTTRVAASPPELWTGILLHNRIEVLRGLAATQDRLAGLVAALQAGDAAAILRWLELARLGRRRFERQSAVAPGAGDPTDTEES